MPVSCPWLCITGSHTQYSSKCSALSIGSIVVRDLLKLTSIKELLPTGSIFNLREVEPGQLAAINWRRMLMKKNNLGRYLLFFVYFRKSCQLNKRGIISYLCFQLLTYATVLLVAGVLVKLAYVERKTSFFLPYECEETRAKAVASQWWGRENNSRLPWSQGMQIDQFSCFLGW